MTAKEIVVLILFIIFGLPFLFGVTAFTSNASHNTPSENPEQAVILIEEGVTPWWVPLTSLSGVVLLFLIAFLWWSGTADI